MASIIEMQQERAKVADKIKALQTRAEKEERDFDGSERDTWAKLNVAFDKLTVDIRNAERAERAAAVEASLDPAPSDKSVLYDENEQFLEEARLFMTRDSGLTEIRINFSAKDVAKNGRGEQRSLLTTTSGVSPGVIPITFVRELREFMFEHAALRQTNATVLITSGGEPIRVPRAKTEPVPTIIAEGEAKQESLPTLDSVVLGAYEFANITQVSDQFLQDEVVNFLDYLARVNGRALGDAAGKQYIEGDGTTEPEGVVVALTALGGSRVLTGAVGNSTTISPEELIRIFHGIASPYRNRSFWLMNDATLAKVRQIRDGSGGVGTGQFMWQPGLQAGAPDTLLGRPVLSDPNVAAMAAGASSIVFGDFSGYYIRDVGGIRFERSDHYAFINDLVTFRAILRTDGKLVDGNGLVLWKNSAS